MSRQAGTGPKAENTHQVEERVHKAEADSEVLPETRASIDELVAGRAIYIVGTAQATEKHALLANRVCELEVTPSAQHVELGDSVWAMRSLKIGVKSGEHRANMGEVRARQTMNKISKTSSAFQGMSRRVDV